MNPEDEEKTTFVTRKGVFCYKVMPFRLKNASATYQHLVTKLYEGLVGKIVEAYIDNMVVKCEDFSSHLNHLEVVFERLRQHRVKLDPAKNKFGVTSKSILRSCNQWKRNSSLSKFG